MSVGIEAAGSMSVFAGNILWNDFKVQKVPVLCSERALLKVWWPTKLTSLGSETREIFDVISENILSPFNEASERQNVLFIK